MADYCCSVPRRRARRFLSCCRRRSAYQHILRISKLLLRLVAEPANVGPVPLFALREPLDQFEVDFGAVLLDADAKDLPRLVPQAEFLQLLQLGEDLFEALIDRVKDLVKAQLPGGVLVTALSFPGVHSFRWFWRGTCWTEAVRSLQVGQTAVLHVPFLAAPPGARSTGKGTRPDRSPHYARILANTS